MRTSRVRALIALFLLTSCVQPPSVNVRETWGSNLYRLGITPIYPPDENRYPGDVIIYVPDPCEGETSSSSIQSVFVDNMPSFQAAFLKFYGNRPQLPETATKPSPTPTTPAPAAPAHPAAPADPATPAAPAHAAAPTQPGKTQATASPAPATNQPALGVSPQPVAPASDPIFWTAAKPREFNRLRISAFPTLTLGSFSQVEASANFPAAHILTLGLAGGVSKRRTSRSASQGLRRLNSLNSKCAR